MAEIQFGTPDSGGDYPESLSSSRPDPASRFFSVVPNAAIVGPRRTTLDRTQHVFALRTDYSIAIVVRHLSPSQLATALALKLWLIAGETVRVVTRSSAGTVFTATLNPGTTPEIALDDEFRGHYSFHCELAKSTAMLIDYTV
jgi:hypothetical protein